MKTIQLDKYKYALIALTFLLMVLVITAGNNWLQLKLIVEIPPGTWQFIKGLFFNYPNG